jgi:hypothetical protein
MIGQGFSESLPYLVPLAVERLQDDPFVSGDFYPGDLLKSVVGIAASIWMQYPDLRREVEAISDRALCLLHENTEMADLLVEDLTAAIMQFKQAIRK